MVDEREDPIEAIKRRNEERARRLRERIAAGDFGSFATPLETVDQALPAGPELLEAPVGDFDLSSFPPPPEPAAILLEPPPPAAIPEEPPLEPPPGAFFEAPPAPLAAGPLSGEIGLPAPPVLEEEPAVVGAPAEDSFTGLELTDFDLDNVGDFLAPEPWEVTAPSAALEEEPVGVTSAGAEVPPPLEPGDVLAGLEIEVEAAAPAAAPETPPMEPVFAEAALPAEMEPVLREEEVEAIKATIEHEIREMEPAAPPMPPRREFYPEPVAAPVAEPVMAEVPEPVGPPITVTPAPEARPEAEVSVGIEVRGNKVRIERRNITLAAAVELFKAIIDRYENR